MWIGVVLLMTSVDQSPWNIYKDVISKANPCYTFNENAIGENNKVALAQKLISDTPGSVILCPCFAQGLAIGGPYNMAANTAIESAGIEAGKLFEETRNNIDANDLLVEQTFVNDFTGDGTGPKPPPGQLMRYHATEKDVDTMIFAFMFQEPIRFASKIITYMRPYGGPFTILPEVFTSYQLLPAIQDGTAVNTTRMWEPSLSADEITDLLAPVWVSHSVPLCYDLWTSALIYEHNREQIAPPNPISIGAQVTYTTSVEPWENHCTGYDCGFPGYSPPANSNVHNLCPSPTGATGNLECIWCIEMSGTSELKSMFTMPSNPPSTWDLDKGELWSTEGGHAAQIAVQSYCALDARCTGYYMGQYGVCISKQTTQPHEGASESKAASIVATVEKYTFPFFMKKREYNEANTEFNFNGASTYTIEYGDTTVYTPEEPSNALLSNFTRYKFTTINGVVLDVSDILTEAQCETRCYEAKSLNCTAYVVAEGGSMLMNVTDGWAQPFTVPYTLTCVLYRIKLAEETSTAPTAPTVTTAPTAVNEYTSQDSGENTPNEKLYQRLYNITEPNNKNLTYMRFDDPELQSAGLGQTLNGTNIVNLTTIRTTVPITAIPSQNVLSPAINQTAYVLTQLASAPTLLECQEQCSLSAECVGCQLKDGTSNYILLEDGILVSNTNKRYAKVDINVPDQCRQQCWTNEWCYAYSWGTDDTGTHCKLITQFDGVNAGINARLGALAALGFSTTRGCSETNYAYDLCTQRCVDIQKHIDAGWCNHLWVNCLEGPFARSNANGERLCTGKYMQADGTRAWNPPETAQAVASDENSATLDNNPGPFRARTPSGTSESACILGAGAADASQMPNDFKDFVLTNPESINYITASSFPPASFYGSIESKDACSGNTACKFGKCMFASVNAPHLLASATRPLNEAYCLKQNTINVAKFKYSWERMLMFKCEKESDFVNVGDCLHRAANDGCCSAAGFNQYCDPVGAISSVEPAFSTGSASTCQQRVDYLNGIYGGGMQLRDNNKKINYTDYYHSQSSQTYADNKYFCRSMTNPDMTFHDLQTHGIFNDQTDAIVNDINTYDHQFVCPLGIQSTTAMDIDQLTLLCPYNRPYKSSMAHTRTDIQGRCGYGTLNGTTFRADAYGASNNYFGADIEFASKCRPIDYVCSKVTDDIPNGEVCGTDGQKEGSCGVMDKAQRSVYNGKPIRVSRSDAYQHCKTKTMEICPKSGYVLRWAEHKGRKGVSVPMCVPLVAASKHQLFPATNQSLLNCLNYKSCPTNAMLITQACIPIKCTERTSEDICTALDIQGTAKSSCMWTDTTCIRNTNVFPDKSECINYGASTRFWPGFVHKENNHAGPGPAWFDEHSKCNATGLCAGIDLGTYAQVYNDAISPMDNVQQCLNKEDFEDRFVGNAKGHIVRHNDGTTQCASWPTTECIGGSSWVRELGLGTCQCDLNPDDTRYFETDIDYFERGLSDDAQCGPWRTNIAPNYGWKNQQAMQCQGIAELLTGSYWDSRALNHGPACGCEPPMDSKYVFRSLGYTDDTLELTNIVNPDASWISKCKHQCAQNSSCIYCVIDTKSRTYHTTGALPTGVTLGATGQLKLLQKVDRDEVIPCCDPTESCAVGTKTNRTYTWTLTSDNGYVMCDIANSTSKTMAKYKCISLGDTCSGIYLYKRTWCIVRSSAQQTTLIYERKQASMGSDNCPKHVTSCKNGVSGCADSPCTQCVCICDPQWTGVLCDKCAKPNRDPLTDCQYCLHNYVQSSTGQCDICNAGYNISDNCESCLHGFTGASCEISACGASTQGGASVVILGYDVTTNTQLYDGTIGISRHKAPDNLVGSLLFDETYQQMYWLQPLYKQLVQLPQSGIQIPTSLTHRMFSAQQGWLKNFPTHENVTSLDVIISNVDNRGYLCYKGPSSSPGVAVHDKLTPEACAADCGNSWISDTVRCIGFFHRRLEVTNVGTCHLVFDASAVSIDVTNVNYLCLNGGIMFSGLDRNIPVNTDVRNLYFPAEGDTHIAPTTGKMRNVILKDMTTNTIYIINDYYKQKVTEVLYQEAQSQCQRLYGGDTSEYIHTVSHTWLSSLPTLDGYADKLPEAEDIRCNIDTEFNWLTIASFAYVESTSTAVTSTFTTPTALGCCKACNSVVDSAYWQLQGNTCTCSGSETGKPENTKVQEYCTTHLDNNGGKYSPWNAQSYPNGCKRAIEMAAYAGYREPQSSCTPVQYALIANPTLSICATICQDMASCTIATFSSSQSCALYTCRMRDLVADSSSTAIVKLGGCIQEDKICKYSPKVPNVHNGALGTHLCSPFGDNNVLTMVSLSTASRTSTFEPHVFTVDETPTCTAANWTASSLWPIHNVDYPFAPIPVRTSELTDALWLQYLEYDSKYFGDTVAIASVPSNTTAENLRQSSISTRLTGTEVDIFVKEPAEASFTITQFQIRALHSTQTCYTRAQEALERFTNSAAASESITCTGATCTSAQESASSFNQLAAQTFYDEEEHCTELYATLQHGHYPNAFAVINPPDQWGLVPLVYSSLYLPAFVAERFIDVGTEPKDAIIPADAPPVEPVAVLEPVQHGNITLFDECNFRYIGNMTLPTGGPHAPVKLATCTSKDHCIEQCVQNPLCSVITKSSGTFEMWEIYMVEAAGMQLNAQMYLDTPPLGCKLNNFNLLVKTSDAELYYKTSCCVCPSCSIQ